MKGFPKKIYVNWVESDSGEPYIISSTSIEFLDEYVDEVAIYELKEVKKLKVTRELKYGGS